MHLTWELIRARLLVKLLVGPIYILSHVEQAMSKIRSAASVTQYRAKATIDRHNIKNCNPTLGSWVGTVTPTYTNIHTSAFVFNDNQSKPVLVITKDGDVEWHGKPSEAADVLVRTFQITVESSKGVTKSARRRYYYMACKNLLKHAEQMEYEEFLAFLNREVYNRERKVIMDGLKNEY